MKHILFTLTLFISAFSQATSTAIDDPNALTAVKPLIIGGELAGDTQWPWMSALVFPYYPEPSSLSTLAGKIFDSSPLFNSPVGLSSGTLASCGIADSICENAEGKICLIARGGVSFSIKALNCQAGGGIGAIIYNSNSGTFDNTIVDNFNGSLGDNFSGNIPVVSINYRDGNTLLQQLNSTVIIKVNDQKLMLQEAFCGATFIGSKWVITAAHCVDIDSIEYVKVNVGEFDLNDDKQSLKTIKRIYSHPNYKEGSIFNNDIALIELEDTVDIEGLALLSSSATLELATNNSPATVMGWGNIEAYGPQDSVPESTYPSKLLNVDLYLLSNDLCKEKLVQGYFETYNTSYSKEQVGITENMICAYYPGGGKGSCQGDSGGPLVVNTNNGWQQVGIVSHGIGCADENFPEVYTRISQYTDWIDSIIKGVEFEPDYDFPITPQYTAQTKQLTITNNNQLAANLSFTVQMDELDSTAFSLTTDNCSILLSSQSCEIKLSFNAQTLGEHEITISVDSGNNSIPTSEINITAQAVPISNELKSSVGHSDQELLWYSGGDSPWIISENEGVISSGVIDDNQHSIALLTFSGSGSLSFEWAVSSEENTNNISNPYDSLSVIVDGELRGVISGQVDFTHFSVSNLSNGEHHIAWIYTKDSEKSLGEDRALIRNIVFSETDVNIVPTPKSDNVSEATTSTPSEKSSGGALYLLLGLLSFSCLRRQHCYPLSLFKVLRNNQ